MNIRYAFFLLLFFLSPRFFNGQNFLEELMLKKSDKLRQVIEEAEKYKIQIIYTQIDMDDDGNPSFKTHTYRVDPKEYFYPASTVKFPAAVLALEKLNRLGIEGLTKYTPLRIDSGYSGQTSVHFDSTSRDNLPSLAHYIKKIFLVSDNDAFNRLYEFLGQRELNQGLHDKGIKDAKLIHRLSIFLTGEENRHTNPFTFYEGDKIIYQQPAQYNDREYVFDLDNVEIGNGYYSGGELLNEPMNFGGKNYISLEALHEILKRVIFPESCGPGERFDLTRDDYEFLYEYMSMLPRESDYPSYRDYDEYYDSYVKFFMFGDTKEKIPGNIKIYNKVGLAYGFLIDNAYITDESNNIEFMLSAVIYVNEDEILNDNRYEYDETGIPFLAELGRVIYEYELSRKDE